MVVLCQGLHAEEGLEGDHGWRQDCSRRGCTLGSACTYCTSIQLPCVMGQQNLQLG